MLSKELIEKLKAPFPPVEHKDRKLPGGGRWFFIPWQTIRQRIQDVAPNYECSFSDPVVAADSMVVRCRLTIGGVTREGVGNDRAYPELNEKGKPKIIGTPIERATADAFKNAAEQFGVGAYLDDQNFVIKHLNKNGDGRGVKYGLMDNPDRQKPRPPSKRKPDTLPDSSPDTSTGLNNEERSRLWKAAQSGGFNPDGFKNLLTSLGYESSEQIPRSRLGDLLEKVSNKDLAGAWNNFQPKQDAV